MIFGRQDTGNADYFAVLFPGKWIYSLIHDSWYVWNGERWERSAHETIKADIIAAMVSRRDTAMQRYEDTKEQNKEWDWASNSLNNSRLEACEKILRTALATPVEFDLDQHRLGFANGVYDFRERKFTPGEQGFLMTKFSPVEYDAAASRAPRWEAFLESIFPGEPHKQRYLEAVSGYAMTGYNFLHHFWLVIGEGGNGKGTWMRLLEHILGSDEKTGYFHTASMDSFLDSGRIRSGEGHTADKAAFVGRRLVVAEETKQGRAFSEGVVKSMTGGGSFNYRQIRERQGTAPITFKIVLVVNHKPIVTDDTEGFWRRIQMIPFDRKIAPEARILDLDDYLRAESAAIVNRCIAAWHQAEDQSQGRLMLPPEWEAAASEYREESDPLSDFVAEMCIVNDDVGTKCQHKTLYLEYREWQRQWGHARSLMSDRTFSQKLMQKGFVKRKGSPNNVYYWHGIARSVVAPKVKTAPEPNTP